MARKSWRKIVVGGVECAWCLPGNCPCCSDGHMLVHGRGASNQQVLRIDALAWDGEIRPQTIRHAIEFALLRGWQPHEVGEGPYLGWSNGSLMVLPAGVKFTHELEHSIG